MPRILALEGPDGCGKSTLATALCAHLRGCGYNVAAWRDPGSTVLGQRCREILLDPKVEMDEIEQTFLFAAASHAMLREVATSNAEVAVLDRCFLSDFAYRGAGPVGNRFARQVALLAGNILPPASVLYLRVAPETLVERRRHKLCTDRFEGRGEDFLRAVSAMYDALAAEGLCTRVDLGTSDIEPNIRQILDAWNNVPGRPPRA